jgi:O-antigen/teichoic acid export membrane protein
MTSIETRLDALTNERVMKRNVGMNLVGWGMPAAAAIVSIPLLTKGLGPDRFGLVALSWAAVGIFSLFDFGLGRALTRMVAERLATGEEHEIREIVWAASVVLLGLTMALAITGMVAAPSIVDGMLHVPPHLRREAVGVVALLAACIPVLAHGVLLRGVLEAGQKFARVNQLRVPLGIVTYAGPLLALLAGGDARIAVGVIVAGRFLYWAAHFPVLSDVAHDAARPLWPSRTALHELARVGGWITVSNVVSPIIVQADRVVVASSFPIATTGWYGAAAEAATKQWLFTSALLPVVFPAMTASVKLAPERAAAMLERASKMILLMLLPAVLVLVLFAAPGLRLWLGPAYAPSAAPVLRWLAAAVYINALAQVAYALLQSGVDARSPALLHMVELPLYVAMLIVLANKLGVVGVAIAWFVRMAVDSVALWWFTYRRMPEARPAIRRIAKLALQCGALIAATAAWQAFSA